MKVIQKERRIVPKTMSIAVLLDITVDNNNNSSSKIALIKVIIIEIEVDLIDSFSIFRCF